MLIFNKKNSTKLGDVLEIKNSGAKDPLIEINIRPDVDANQVEIQNVKMGTKEPKTEFLVKVGDLNINISVERDQIKDTGQIQRQRIR